MNSERICIRLVIPDPEPAVLLEVVDADEGRVEIWGAEWRQVWRTSDGQ